MNKVRLFVENFLVYGLGGIISKIIPLVMVPIVTRLMPSTDYYGLSDLSNTLVSLSSALAVMGMYDAMYRMFFEKEEEEFKKSVCSTALIFTLFTSVVVFLLMLLFQDIIAQFFFSDKRYSYIVYLSAMATLVGATNSIISAPTRMQNKRRIFLIANTLSPLISYSIAIPLLLAGYYTIALPLAAVLSSITMEIIFAILNHSWFVPRRFNITILKQLLIIAVPLFPNFLIYWVFNSSDKIMITNILGIASAGIYSVGSKFGHCSQLIYSAFAGGWQYFAFSTMKEDNQVKNNSMIFEYLGIISYIATMYICALAYPLFKVLFEAQYITGYIVAPYLFLAPLLQMLFQVACNQFLIEKRTWPNMFILSIGAMANIIMNYFLIPVLGIEGASFATLLGYVMSVIICVIVLCKRKLMLIEKRFILASLVMFIFFFIWRIYMTTKVLIGLCFATLLFICFVFLYKNDIKSFVQKIRK